MRKCSLSDGAVSPLSQQQYDHLQFDYDKHHSLPLNNDLSENHDNLSDTYIIPICNNNNEKDNSSVLPRKLKVDSGHSCTAFSGITTADNTMTMFETNINGYCLSDQFREELNMPTNRNHSSVVDDGTTQKTSVTIKADGTGIIKTGRLQAVIPSDENYKVIPSQDHKSYFDVVKST